MILLIFQALVLASGFFILFRLVNRYINYVFTPLHKIPGPPSTSFWVGQHAVIRKEPFMEPHKRWWKDAGEDVPLLHYQGALGQSSLVILDKNIVKEILTAPSGKEEHELRFYKKMAFLANRAGDGLASLQGHDWSRHRKIIQPAFHVNLLKESLGAIVPQRVTQFVKAWSKVAEQPQREIDLASHLSALTLDIIGDVAFSHEFGAIRNVDKWANSTVEDDEKLDEVDDPFIQAISECFRFTAIGTIMFLMGTPALDRFLNPTTVRVREALDEAVEGIVQNARKLSERGDKAMAGRPTSLLQFLLQAKENAEKLDATNGKASAITLSDAELRNELKTFIVAGHETTSTFCYWAIYAMATRPEMQGRVFEEMKGCGMDLETIEALPYFDAFLNEVLRLYSPAGMLVRYNRFGEKLAGFHIPPNTRMIITPHLLHRNPKYWDEPESFRPERWMHADEEARCAFLERTRFAFIPFSAGGRNCIGQRFAMMEAKLILAQLIQSFKFQIAPSQRETDFVFTSYITMKLKPGLKVSITSRS